MMGDRRVMRQYKSLIRIGQSAMLTRHRLPLRHIGLYRAIGWALVVFVVWASLTPHPPDLGDVEGADKLGHFAAYATLMFWFAQLYRAPAWPWIALGCVVLGAGLEVVQGMVAYRSADLVDLVADATGVALGALGALTPLVRVLPRMESRAYNS